MKKNIHLQLLGISVLFLCFELNAQQSMFTKVYYDVDGMAQAYATIQAPDHNFYIAGEKDGRPMAMKAAPDGTIVWAKNTGSFENAFYDLVLAGDSGVVFAGRTYNEVTLSKDVLLMKIDTYGDTLWTRTLDLGEDEYPMSIQLIQDGGFILCCTSGTRTAVIRLNSAGDPVWSKMFSVDNTTMAVFSVTQSSDGGFYMTGAYDGYPSWDGIMFLARLEGDGTCSWASLIITGDYSTGLGVVVQPDGLVCLLTCQAGLCLLKTDLLGNPQWCRPTWLAYNTPWPGVPAPRLHLTSDGGFTFVDGAQWGPGYAVKSDSNGDPVLRATVFMNTSDITETNDGGYLFTGNGPVFGVEMAGTDNPQIGLIKADSLFTSTGCVWPDWPLFDVLLVYKDTFEFNSVNAGSVYIMPYEISDAVLSTDSGCVAYLGAVPDAHNERTVLQVYPNPSAGIFNIGLAPEGSEKIKKIEIFNSTGLQIFMSSYPEAQIDLTSAPSGLYLVRVETSDGTFTPRLLICH